MNYFGQLFIFVVLFTASIVCQNDTSNGTATTTTEQPITTTLAPPMEPNDTTTVTPPTTTLTTTTTESPLGNWTVLNENGTICIWVKMEAEFQISYNATNSTTEETNVILEPSEAKVRQDSSSCEAGLLVLQFGKNNLTFAFAKNDKSVYLENITLGIVYDSKTFPNATEKDHVYQAVNKEYFKASTGMSYLCNANTDLELSDSTKIKVQDVQVEAYRTEDKSGFSQAEDCAADDDVSDIVPIAVGCALAGLVVIVLLAYLIGRRNKRQKGYESV